MPVGTLSDCPCCGRPTYYKVEWCEVGLYTTTLLLVCTKCGHQKFIVNEVKMEEVNDQVAQAG